MPNVITAIFNKKAPDVDTAPIYQYNYGQVLRIEGLDLPPAVEIHFSLDSKHGTSVTRIGNTRDGITEVVIPDPFLEAEQEENYMLYAFIFLVDETSGTTEKVIRTKIQVRPKPEVPGPPCEKGLFEDVVNSVNAAATRANASETAAAASAAEAAQTKEDILIIKNDIDSDITQFAEDYKTATSNLESARVSALKDITDAGNTAVGSVNSAANTGLGAIDDAKQDALKGVAEKKAEIEKATETADKVVEQINAADTKLTETMKTADAKKTALDESITNAGKSKTALDDSKTAADKSKTDLDASKQAADKSKSDLDASKTAADKSKADLAE